MEDKFRILLDLLLYYEKFPDKVQNLEEIGDFLRKNINKEINFFCKYNFLFKTYKDFLEEKISEEEFFKLGDIESSKNILDKDNSRLFFENKLFKNLGKESVVVLDEIRKFLLSDDLLEEFEDYVKQNNIKVFWI